MIVPGDIAGIKTTTFSNYGTLGGVAVSKAPRLKRFTFTGLRNIEIVGIGSGVPPGTTSATFSNVGVQNIGLIVPENDRGLCHGTPK